jgi:hypothetical protein
VFKYLLKVKTQGKKRITRVYPKVSGLGPPGARVANGKALCH